jgi:hypothetical protein
MGNLIDQLNNSSGELISEAILKTISKSERSQTESAETLLLKDFQSKSRIWQACCDFIDWEKRRVTKHTLDPPINLEFYQKLQHVIYNDFLILKTLQFVNYELYKKL